MPAFHEPLFSQSQDRVSYGAMMARALDVGIEIGPSCEDTVPIGVVEAGTASSQPSSWRESCDLLDVYQEPAWLASREDMLDVEKGETTGSLCGKEE